ncbi:COX assembly mitochondrial protein-like protein [Frankliniella fusca]|uniref:COX assembly mitochondrial protein-like protein n=1 Tax=Frankliniella fusca TaxID=407009 RepID=A0AAE1LVZ6_9NEOP|nr:COX assembly mitochondrial protein-like protein [Frankliniella fusca]
MRFNYKTKLQQMFETMEREGEPDDEYLNQVELKIILPRACQNRVESVHCRAEIDALKACREKYGFVLSPLCFLRTIDRGICLLRNRDSPDLKDDCTELYLALRSHYRKTKDPETLRRMKAMIPGVSVSKCEEKALIVMVEAWLRCSDLHTCGTPKSTYISFASSAIPYQRVHRISE